MTHGIPGRDGRRRGLVVALACAMASAAWGEQEPAAPAPSPSPSAEVPGYEYRIGPEDVLQIAVWQNAELSRTLPVRPDGKISLPLVNDIQAAGLTPMELRDALKARLAEYVPAGEISVIVGEVQSFNVSLIGKVQRADRYKLKAPTSVLDLLALGGGFAEFADTDRIVVLRPEIVTAQGRSRQTFQRIPFNYKRVIGAGGETENIALRPGDIVVVP